MRTPANEREVHIQFNTDEDVAHVYTSDYSYMNRFDKLCEKNPDEWKLIEAATNEGDVVSKSYECPRKYISFRSKNKVKVMTEEQRKIASERMKKFNASRSRF